MCDYANYMNAKEERAERIESIEERCNRIADSKHFDGEISDGIHTLAEMIVGLAKDGKGQRAKAIEELAELIEVLSDNKRAMGDRYMSLAEEIADAEIMIQQIIHYAGISRDTINKMKDLKLIRQESR